MQTPEDILPTGLPRSVTVIGDGFLAGQLLRHCRALGVQPLPLTWEAARTWRAAVDGAVVTVCDATSPTPPWCEDAWATAAFGDDGDSSRRTDWVHLNSACTTGFTQLPAALRTQLDLGLVLSADGGPFPALVRQAKWGFGGAGRAGDQPVAWVHADDVVGAVEYIWTTPTVRGTFTVAAPHAPTKGELLQAIRRRYGAVIGLPAPTAASRALDCAAAGSRGAALPGYTFGYPELSSALDALIGTALDGLR